MKCKTLGLICILIATTGFGFVNWYQNNKISNLQTLQEDLTTERNHYAHAYERFTSSGELKKLIHETVMNIGLLFAKIDLKFSGKIRPQTEKGIKTANENMLKADHKRLLELAYTAASSKESKIAPDDYVSQIKTRLSDSSDRNEYDKIRDEVVAKIGNELERVQAKRKNIKNTQIRLQNNREIRDTTHIC